MAQRNTKPEVSFPLRNNSAISIIPKSTPATSPGGVRPLSRPGSGPGYRPFADKEIAKRSKPVATGAAKPQVSQVHLTNQVSLQRVSKAKQDHLDHSSVGENSNSSDSQLRTDQRVEEVRVEDIVGEASSNNEYSPTNSNQIESNESNNDGDNSLQKHTDDKSQVYGSEHISTCQGIQTQQHNEVIAEIKSKLDNNLTHSDLKESSKSEQMANYGQSFSSQLDKRDSHNDEITIEKTSLGNASKLAPPSSVPGIQQPQLHQPQPLQPHAQRPAEIAKNVVEPSHSATIPLAANAAGATGVKERDTRVQEISPGDPHGLSQGYPYAQYPRYYDYADPRARTLPSPYGTYFPGVTPHPTNPRLNVDSAKPQADLAKPVDDRTTMSGPTAYSQTSSSTAKAPVESSETKTTETAATSLSATSASREEAHVPTAFSHPASSRYPGPYPPTPYDPYAQHYPPAPGASAAYPPSGKLSFYFKMYMSGISHDLR